MAKRTTKKGKSRSKKKSSGNVFTKILIILFVLILAAFLIFRFIPKINSNKEQKADTQLVNEEKKETKKDTTSLPKQKPVQKPIKKSTVAKSIEGCWMSTTGGAVLTMKDFEYRIDFMGVDVGKPIVGTYLVEDNIVTFTNKKEPCKDEKGVYDVEFDKQEISFRCKNDGCIKRKSTLTTDWEWLDE